MATHNLTVRSTAGGTATASAYSGEEGTPVTLTATPEDNYTFVGWLRTYSSSFESRNVSYSWSMPYDETFTAVFAKVSVEYGTTSISRYKYTATAATGYCFSEWEIDESAVSFVTTTGADGANTATLQPIPAKLRDPAFGVGGVDITATAVFRELTAADGYGIYLRWNSTYTFNGTQVTNTFRVNPEVTSGTTLKRWVSTSTDTLDSVANSSPRTWKSGGIYYANYFPMPTASNGRRFGAIRDGYELVGWRLFHSDAGEGDIILPTDGTTTINQIAQYLDNAGTATFNSNSAGVYRVVVLTAVWGKVHTITSSISGAEVESTPPVITVPATGVSGSIVTFTAQTSGLTLCDFSEWSVVDSDGEAVEFEEDPENPGIITLTVPDSDITATAVYTPKPQYDLDVSDLEEEATVTYSREKDGDDGWISGLTVTITPDEGKTIKSWQVVNEDDAYVTGSPSGFVETEDEVEIVITDAMLSPDNGNLTVTAVFGDVVYTADASIDQASATAISSVSVSNDTQETSTGQYVDGDTVRFTANMMGDPGYAFDGWYLNGEKVSSDATYDYEDCPIGGVSLVAKAKSAVGFAVDDATRATVSTSGIDDQGYAVLGSTVSYELTVNAGYYFTGWYLNNEDPTALDTEGSLTITAPVSYTARTSTTPPSWRITVCPRSFTGGMFRTEEYPSSNVVFTNITAIVGSSEHPSLAASQYTNQVESDEYNSVSYIQVSVPSSFQTTEIVDGEEATTTLAFVGWYTAEPTSGGPDATKKVSGIPTETFILSGGSLTYYAVYGYSQPVDVTVDLFDGDTGKGTVRIEFTPGDGESLSPDAKSATVKQGHEVTLVAQSNIQYRFIGWYSNATDPDSLVSTASIFTFDVLSEDNYHYYAHFGVNPDAIYEWEGADTNKLLEWRSKVYKGAIPFNPTSCRVDAVGYPVVRFRVEMFSAPDDDPTAIATLDNAGAIQSDRARRLPIRRLERYMAVDVQSNTEIDTMTVGTSMEGLRQ